MKDRRKYHKMVHNSFCPTGPGGGVDPSCSPSNSGGSSKLDHPSTAQEATNRVNMAVDSVFGKVGHNDQYGSSRLIELPGGRQIHVAMKEYNSKDPYTVQIDFGIKGQDNTFTNSKLEKESLTMLRQLKQLVESCHELGLKVSVVPSDEKRKTLYEHVLKKVGLVKIYETSLGRQVWNTAQVPLVTNRRPLPPSRYDPTRTTTLRRAFVTKIRRQFAKLKAAVYRLIVVEDALGLKKSMTYNVFCPTGPGGGVDPSCSPQTTTVVDGKTLTQEIKNRFPEGERQQHALSAAISDSPKYFNVLSMRDANGKLNGVASVWKESDEGDSEGMPKGKYIRAGNLATAEKGHGTQLLHELIKYADSKDAGLYLSSTERSAQFYKKSGMNEGLGATYYLTREEVKHRLSSPTANHIVKLPSGKYRLLSHEGKNLGTFDSREEAAKHEGEVEYFKHVTNERWRFHATDEQLKAFQEWLKQQTDLYVRGMTEEELWNRYIQDGFKKGAGRAFDDTDKQLGWEPEEAAFYAGTKEQFLKSAFGRPESLEKVKLLAARTFEELNGMTDDMRNKLGRILTQGLIQGDGPVAIAREMTKQLDLSRARAETIARTELIRAHAEGQLVGLEEMGVDEVGVMVEWSTAGDDRVCELCEPMEGVVLKIEEARGMIPRHPNCRCAFVPANVAEPTDDQKRGKRSIVKAVKTSASLGKDDFSTAVPVSKERPKSVLPVIANAFCPTGPGGGQDNSCSPFSTSAVDFGEDVHKQYKDAPKIRVTDEDVRNVKSALKLRGALNKDGTVTLYHDTIDDPETISSILKHGLIPSAQPASGQTWKATHSSYSTYFHQDLSAARGLQSTAADEFLTTIEARIPVTKEFLKRVIPDEESGGVHEGVAQLISGAGAPAVIGGVPAKYLSSRKYSKPAEPKPTKTSRTTHPHEDSILQAAGELNGSKYKGRLSIGERISSKLYKESGKKINLSGAEVNEVLKQHSSELSKYGISINTQPAPSVVYQFSQLLAGARK